MTLTRLRTRAYAAGLAAVFALAGCGDPEGASGPAATAGGTGSASSVAATSPATANATTTAEVDPVLARIPAAARPETSAGAEAFTAFFFKQINHSWSSGDPAALEGLFASECKTCVAFHDGAEELREAGQHHQGETLSVEHLTVSNFVDPKRELTVWVTQNAVPVVNDKGVKVSMTKAAKGAFIVTVKFQGRWVVSRLQTAKS